MKNIELPLGAEENSAVIERALEAACSSAGLCCTMKDTLRSYPGCIHWHFKNGRESGTLEVTYWPEQRRAWISIQSRRSAAWIEEAIPVIRKSLRDGLRK